MTISLKARLPLAMVLALISLSPWGPLSAQTAETNPLQLFPHHATASVADLEKESAWYQRVLGFHEIARMHPGPDFEVLHMGIPGYRIDLVRQKGSIRQHDATGYFAQGWLHVVFKTPVIDADYKRLVDLGTDVKADRDAQSAISRLVLHDPEGNELEIVPQ
jgi:catechol 2,3-dioxygenase-like lactoylglutathione lyase family enzyme